MTIIELKTIFFNLRKSGSDLLSSNSNLPLHATALEMVLFFYMNSLLILDNKLTFLQNLLFQDLVLDEWAEEREKTLQRQAQNSTETFYE